MKTEVGKYVTAIISGAGRGKVVQGEVTCDPQIAYRWIIAGLYIEDYRDDYDCYFQHMDDGKMLGSARVLENADSLQDLTIDPSTIDVPSDIDNVPMVDIYKMASDGLIEHEDVQFYEDLMSSPAVMYDLYLANNKDIDKTHQAFIAKIVQDQNQFRNDMLGAVGDFMDDFGIDEILDENGNKIL